MNKNYLLSLEEHFPQRPMCHRKITFSRGRLSKCKAPGKVALEFPWDLGERDNTHEGGMPPQPGKMPAWTRGKHSVSHRSNHRAAGAGGYRQASISWVQSHQGHCSLGKYYCAVLSLWLGGMHVCESCGTWKQGLEASAISAAPPTLRLRMSVEQWRAGSQAGRAFWRGPLLLITAVRSPALLVMTHQCPLIKPRHRFSYHDTHQLCCASSWSHFLLRKWIPTVHSHSIRPTVNL